MNSVEIVKKCIFDSIDTKKKVLSEEKFIEKIETVSDEIFKVIKNGGKILICGNGGSASDALHMAGEIVGRFQKERNAWPALALNADIASMTAIANDYGYDEIFSRATEAYMTKKDIIVGISTSGNSENIYRAILKAKDIGGKTIALLGKDGGKIAVEADYSIIIPSDITARIQESHIMIIHILCELIELKMLEG